jgi:hypothetical protein
MAVFEESRYREKVVVQFENCHPSAAKAATKNRTSYRSGEPLRHPKSSATSGFSTKCKAVRFQNRFKLRHYPRELRVAESAMHH